MGKRWADRGRLMDELIETLLVAWRGEPFEYRGKNRTISLSYWQLPERLYEYADELAEWARRAPPCRWP